MKEIEKVLEVLGAKIISLEMDVYLKDDEIKNLKKQIETRPSTAKAEETR